MREQMDQRHPPPCLHITIIHNLFLLLKLKLFHQPILLNMFSFYSRFSLSDAALKTIAFTNSAISMGLSLAYF